MKIRFANPVLARSFLSTEHPTSSYGIPVLVDEEGNAYGPADKLPSGDGLEWMYGMYGLTESPTAGDLVRVHIIEEFGGCERSEELKTAAKSFLGLLETL